MHQALLQASVASDKASYADGEEAALTTAVTDDAGPIDGVAIYVVLTTANGSVMEAAGLTGVHGMASLRYLVDAKRDGLGAYVVDVMASRDGFEAASDSVLFNVTERSAAPDPPSDPAAPG